MNTVKFVVMLLLFSGVVQASSPSVGGLAIGVLVLLAPVIICALVFYILSLNNKKNDK